MNKYNLINCLIDINAISFAKNQKFRWKSGIESPIYIDNRLIMSYPNLREKISSNLAQLILDNYQNEKINIIFGTATAGIAPGVLASSILKLPFGYVRGESKSHGQNKAIEGYYQPKWKAVIIEDTVSTGSSVLNVVNKLKAQEIEVLGVIAIFSYDLAIAQKSFIDHNLKFNCLLTFHDLINYPVFTKQEYKSELQMFYNTVNN